MDVGYSILDLGMCYRCGNIRRSILVGMGRCARVFGVPGLEDIHGCERGNGWLDGRRRGKRRNGWTVGWGKQKAKEDGEERRAEDAIPVMREAFSKGAQEQAYKVAGMMLIPFMESSLPQSIVGQRHGLGSWPFAAPILGQPLIEYPEVEGT